MVKKPTSGDSEQRDRDAERARKASQLSSASGFDDSEQRRPSRGRRSPSNSGPSDESAHGALLREGIDSD